MLSLPGRVFERVREGGEEGDGRDTEVENLLRFLDEPVDREAELPRHRVDGLALALAVDHEERHDEVVGGEPRLAGHAADRVGAPEPAGAVKGRRGESGVVVGQESIGYTDGAIRRQA